MWCFGYTEVSKTEICEKNCTTTKHSLTNAANADYVVFGDDSTSITSPSKLLVAESEYRLETMTSIIRDTCISENIAYRREYTVFFTSKNNRLL